MTGGDSGPGKAYQAEVKHLQPSARPSVPGGSITAADARGPGFLEEVASQIQSEFAGTSRLPEIFHAAKDKRWCRIKGCGLFPCPVEGGDHGKGGGDPGKTSQVGWETTVELAKGERSAGS